MEFVDEPASRYWRTVDVVPPSISSGGLGW
jgi:hypothetical protein